MSSRIKAIRNRIQARNLTRTDMAATLQLDSSDSGFSELPVARGKAQKRRRTRLGSQISRSIAAGQNQR